MPKKKENEDRFEVIGKDALCWLAQAQSLKLSADAILPKLKEAFAIPPALPGAQEKRFAFWHSYMLLVGLAFENLIKGTLVGRNPALVDRKKIKNGILGRKGHGIAEGARKVIVLTPNEFGLLRRVEEYLFWAGRYPLPLTSGEYHNSEVHELRSGRSDDPSTINALFDKIVDVLEKEQKA